MNNTTPIEHIGQLPINLFLELSEYDLLWETGVGFISTFCKSKRTAKSVSKILKKHGVIAHSMNMDQRIIVIYF